MKTKELVEQYINSPVKVGDLVGIRGRGIQDKKAWGQSTEVLKINEDGSIEVEGQNQKIDTVLKENYKKNPFFIGVNPIPSRRWNSSLRMISYSLDSILYAVGYDRRRKQYSFDTLDNVEVAELNWNPYIIDSKGEKVYYQRELVWSLKDKQLLIESIYNSIDIGKLVLRKRSFDWVRNEIKKGNKEVFFKDIVDGKQRLNALLGFLDGEFPDLKGNYFYDFSEKAVREFMNFSAVGYGELEENATDEDVKNVFLGINFTGVQMSQEHIDFVKNINL